MIIRFSEQTLEDTIEIHESLEQFKVGLGDRFYDQLRIVYEQMKNNANSFQSLDEFGNKRRAFVKLSKKLHYRIIYELFPNYLEIQAIKNKHSLLVGNSLLIDSK